MALSAAHKEALVRAQVDFRQLVAVELNHSTFSGSLRFVNYTSDISVSGKTFYATAMEVAEPPVSVDAVNTMTISIDGVSGIIQPYLYDAAQLPEPVYVTVAPFGYNLSTGSVLEVGYYQLEMLSNTITAERIVLNCGIINSANAPFPSVRYKPETHGGLY